MMKVLLLIHVLTLVTDSTVSQNDCQESRQVKQQLTENCIAPDNPGTAIASSKDTPTVNNKERIGLGLSVPNPAVNYTSISYRVGIAGRLSLKLYNMLGIVVYTLIDEAHEPGNYTVFLDVSDLPKGNYFYVLTTGSSVKTRKLTVNR